jgi:mono/diheme cytochrome c family protein
MKNFLAPALAIGLTVSALASLANVACGPGDAPASANPTKTEPAAAPAKADVVKRGEYLVTMIGCSDCHTPMKMGPNGPEPDMARFLSGHPEQMGALKAPKMEGPWLSAGAATNTAFAGPWGISYTANLTPDRNTGLGIWDEQMFVNAIRQGRHMGTSRPILPPMPWPAFRNATDEDLKAIYAYLRTIPPVVNHVPDVQPPAAATTN